MPLFSKQSLSTSSVIFLFVAFALFQHSTMAAPGSLRASKNDIINRELQQCPRDFPGDGSVCPAMNVQCRYPGIPSSRPGEIMTCNCGSDNKFNCRERGRGCGSLCATKESVGDVSKIVPENQKIVLEAIPESLPINTVNEAVPETQTPPEQATGTISQTLTWYVIPPDPIVTSAVGAIGDCPKRTPKSGESCVEYIQVERSPQLSCTYNNIQCNCALQGGISIEKGWSCRNVGISF